MKKVITNKADNVVIYISTKANNVSNGIEVDDCIIAIPNGDISQNPYNIFDVENVPSEVKIQKYCYDATNGFTLNPDYKEPVNLETKVAELEAQNAQMLLALVEGGLL